MRAMLGKKQEYNNTLRSITGYAAAGRFQKTVDVKCQVCYIRLAMEVGLFFMLFFKLSSESLWHKRKHNEFNGGGSCAHENNTGMYGMQKP